MSEGQFVELFEDYSEDGHNKVANVTKLPRSHYSDLGHGGSKNGSRYGGRDKGGIFEIFVELDFLSI